LEAAKIQKYVLVRGNGLKKAETNGLLATDFFSEYSPLGVMV
jgi:hypothetical protein